MSPEKIVGLVVAARTRVKRCRCERKQSGRLVGKVVVYQLTQGNLSCRGKSVNTGGGKKNKFGGGRHQRLYTAD